VGWKINKKTEAIIAAAVVFFGVIGLTVNSVQGGEVYGIIAVAIVAAVMTFKFYLK